MQFGMINKYILFVEGDLLFKSALFLKRRIEKVTLSQNKHYSHSVFLQDLFTSEITL